MTGREIGRGTGCEAGRETGRETGPFAPFPPDLRRPRGVERGSIDERSGSRSPVSKPAACTARRSFRTLFSMIELGGSVERSGRAPQAKVGLLIFVAATLLTLGGFAGCASTAPAGEAAEAAGDPYAAVPEDFTLDLTVLVGRAVSPEVAERKNRPARIVLFADGSLHAAFDERRRAHTVPGYVRTLSRGEMASLWTELRQLGFASPEASDPVVNFGAAEPRRRDVITLLALTGSKERWVFTRSRGADEPSDGAFQSLIDRLAQLAWAGEPGASRRMIMPRRYDLGDDPYEQYR